MPICYYVLLFGIFLLKNDKYILTFRKIRDIIRTISVWRYDYEKP